MARSRCGSFIAGDLPEGCVHCQAGAKMVLFVTGLCRRRCFYCPVSAEKMYRDVAYANERVVHSDEDVLDEARKMRAGGTGITGGDPMEVPERVLHYIGLLKGEFGRGHHIHLYTGIVFDPAWLGRLAAGGLDEVRFHPPHRTWGHMGGTPHDGLIRAALEAGMRVGVEVPALPGREADTLAMALHLDSLGVEFLTLNELEVSAENAAALRQRGYETKSDEECGIRGAAECARFVAERWARDARPDRGGGRLQREGSGRAEKRRMAVHHCSSVYKDAVQLRRRLLRRADVVAQSFDRVTEDGTLVRGLVETDDPVGLQEFLRGRLRVPGDAVGWDVARGVLWVEAGVLREVSRRVPARCFIVEEYPTETHLEVERVELPSALGGR
ncbi:MAG: radical SAM protein [Euryarchaeota archaeon]|nr:radical SAM protein [Euryarchaeota archaeon]